MKAAHSLIFISSLLLVSGRPIDNPSEPSGTSVLSSFSTDTASATASIPLSTSPVPLFNSSSKSAALAVDEDTGAVVGYDANGKYLGQVNGTDKVGSKSGLASSLAVADTVTTTDTCRQATQSDLSNIPGWSTFVAKVTAWAGQTPASYYLNDTDTGVGATICYSTDTVQMSVQGNPSCTSNEVSTDGSSEGTNSTITIKVTKGTSTSYTTKTEKTSSFTWNDQITATVDVGVAKVSDQQTLSVALNNSEGTEDTQTSNDQTSVQQAVQNPDGKHCSAMTNVTDCAFTATGSLDVYFTGYVWMSFKTWFRDPVCVKSLIAPGAPCAGKGSAHNDLNHCYDANSCPTHGHWGQRVDDYLPNITDRSNPLQFSNALTSTTYANYTVVCV
ncbi:hypothetical protein B0H11DRAFT_2122983 [Mycena galericulata]|nr:hypothetical protein B0H11DRAFT_2122983 [Mycena galericulata]